MTITDAETLLYQMIQPAVEDWCGTRVYGHALPADIGLVGHPCVLYVPMSVEDVWVWGGERAMVSCLYAIRGVYQDTSWDMLRLIDAALDQALHMQAHSDGTYRIDCVRVRPLAMIEIERGVQVRHLGGIYRVYLTRA